MDNAFKKSLKQKAHHLKPVILVGAKGITDSLVAETDLALTTHELIKVKINGAEKEDRPLMFQSLCEQLNAELVQVLGHTGLLYRKNIDK